MVYTNRPPKPLEIVTPGAVYAHYKSNELYRVLGVAIDGNKDAEPNPQVIYTPLLNRLPSPPQWYRRSVKEWVELVQSAGAWVSRYTLVDPGESLVFIGRNELLEALRESVACWNAVTKNRPSVIRTDILLTKALLTKVERIELVETLTHE